MPTRDGQYHTDEFIGEIIGIGRLWSLTIDMLDERHCGIDRRVVVAVVLGHGPSPDAATSRFVGRGKSMGFALAEAREGIREHFGR